MVPTDIVSQVFAFYLNRFAFSKKFQVCDLCSNWVTWHLVTREHKKYFCLPVSSKERHRRCRMAIRWSTQSVYHWIESSQDPEKVNKNFNLCFQWIWFNLILDMSMNTDETQFWQFLYKRSINKKQCDCLGRYTSIKMSMWRRWQSEDRAEESL